MSFGTSTEAQWFNTWYRPVVRRWPGRSTDGGQLQEFFSLSEFLPPGAYTVGFTLTDEARLSTSYGTPGGQPVPGGPLQFTVTP